MVDIISALQAAAGGKKDGPFAFVGSSYNDTGGANSTTLTVSIPPGNENDLLFLISAENLATGHSTPSGWTLLADPVSDGRTAIYYKFSDGSETSVTNTTATSCAMSAVVLRFSGDFVDPIIGSVATADPASPGDITAPAVSSAAGDFVMQVFIAGALSRTFSEPTVSDGTLFVDSNANQGSIAIFYELNGSSDATSTRSGGTGVLNAAQIRLRTTGVFDFLTDFLVVGGGGGGGGSLGVFDTATGGGGGGGAGGVVSGFAGLSTGTTYDITVGNGGSGGAGRAQGSDGQSSSLDSLVSASGGGGGAADNASGSNGACGGGAGGSSQTATGGSGTDGFDGGDSLSGTNNNGAGGGGMGAAGQDGGTTAGNFGDGGDGITSSITGSSVYYGGGGGGGEGADAINDQGDGGLGGGGAGGRINRAPNDAVAGTANTGGGGGGGADNTGTEKNGAAGGSGVVILRSLETAASTTGSPTVTTDGSYTIYKFTSSGSITY